MLDRLWIALVAAVLSLGLAAEAGALAWTIPDATPCQSQMSFQTLAGHEVPTQDCDGGTAHMTCTAHATCSVALAPASAPLSVGDSPADWEPAAPPVLTGGRLPPDTPPPIALI